MKRYLFLERRMKDISSRFQNVLDFSKEMPTAILNSDRMKKFISGIWKDNPILQRVADAQKLKGAAQVKELRLILQEFRRQTGVVVETVEEGVVQASRGSGNFASLRSKPGYLQIERQVFSIKGKLMEEVMHELAFYYSRSKGFRVVADKGIFNGLRIIELMIQAFGKYPLK